MRLGIRERLFIITVLLIVTGAVSVEVYLASKLGTSTTGATEASDVLATIRWTLFVASVVAVIFAVAVSWLASYWMSDALRGIVDVAQVMASGQRRTLPPEFDRHELGGLAGSLNKLAGDLEGAVNTLARERDRFETVLQSMEEALLSIDLDRNIEMMNESAIRLLDLPGRSEGRRLVEVVRIPALVELVDSALDNQQSAVVEFDLPTRRRRVLARATPQDATGGLVVVMHDVTEIRRLETVRRDFVANVSHELRTPVSIIRANAETLLAGAIDERAQAERFLEALVRNADRLGRLISDLLDISRIEAGKYSIEGSVVDVRTVAKRVIDAVDTKARSRDVAVRVVMQEPSFVVGDPKALEQILSNLIDNAVNYSPKGGAVEVRAHQHDGRVRIEVLDDGPGIDPIHRPRVFERFYRIDAGRSRDMGGTGLGLSIVKHLVEAMSGTVGVDARVPQGSIFWVRLPAAAGTKSAAGEPIPAEP